jgi:tRNA pseudouridine38-40 synthase
MTPLSLRAAMNGLLPEDVRVLEAAHAPPGFHARRSALSKLYRYVLDTGPVRIPTRRSRAGHVRWLLDPKRVAAAAALFNGRHDFASLASAGGSTKTTVRTVLRSESRFEPTEPSSESRPGESGGSPIATGPATLVYEVEADGFLRKMVRSMVGGLVAAGRGTVGVDELRDALLARDRRAWPAPVEPCGLTLVRVTYPTAAPPMLE